MKEREQIIQQPKVIIVGYGIVGKHLKNLFTFSDFYEIDILDLFKKK